MRIAPLVARGPVAERRDEDIRAVVGEDVFQAAERVLAFAVAGPDEGHASSLSMGMREGGDVVARPGPVLAVAVCVAGEARRVFDALVGAGWEAGQGFDGPGRVVEVAVVGGVGLAPVVIVWGHETAVENIREPGASA